jgi:hypothetical protein
VPWLRNLGNSAEEFPALNYSLVTPRTMGINPVEIALFSGFSIGTLTPVLKERYFAPLGLLGGIAYLN